MKITADNRGRLALSKIDTLILNKMGVSKLPGSEWEVTCDSGELKVKPVSEKPKSEWRVIYPEGLQPEDIGTVIGVRAKPDSIVPKVIENYYTGNDALWGVLEMFSNVVGGDVEVKLVGHDDVFSAAYREGKPRLREILVKR